MKKAWHSSRHVIVLMLTAVWFLTVAHTAVCHSENALSGHDGCAESTVCACFCHMAFEPCNVAPIYVGQPALVSVPSMDETVRRFLLPAAIFRPPLTNS
jgi:hypothetical protein